MGLSETSPLRPDSLPITVIQPYTPENTVHRCTEFAIYSDPIGDPARKSTTRVRSATNSETKNHDRADVFRVGESRDENGELYRTIGGVRSSGSAKSSPTIWLVLIPKPTIENAGVPLPPSPSTSALPDFV